ncbi:hypothetical protein SLEP1_g54434 [Rubroshorea leprosula]|uniref:Uncharacterized protein n=1 Tax=Rubroshorea leprosula TaxID=152421 RepID=A0AAV5MDH4_9ROSI|nr:hypothetical protein SLEP1_g54434 [Rubroshorea leprosula]
MDNTSWKEVACRLPPAACRPYLGSLPITIEEEAEDVNKAGEGTRINA